jgi:ABC-type branched-subunit amino acid transport system substrate-binding protein
LRIGATVAALSLVAASCGRSDSKSEEPSSSSSKPAAATSADFGTIKDVCQRGDAGGASAPGVTHDSIKLAVFSDRGSSVRPGLNQELFDAAHVFADWCNDHGGINGRKIDILEEDAALFNVPPKMTDACTRDAFFIVGGGAAFDDAGEKIRLECMLPSVPGYVASTASRGADLTVQPVPNPNNAVGYGQFKWLEKKYPGSVGKVGVLAPDIPTTRTISDQTVESVKSLGFKIVSSDLFPAAGNVSYSPYVAALKSRGVRGLIYTGEPETLGVIEQTMRDQNYKVDWIAGAANLYDKRLLEQGGDAIRNTYIVTTFAPFEQADRTPALAQYLSLFKKYLPDGKAQALLGVQGFSAWLLFAQAAKECGTELTRRCVYDNLKKVHSWTGGGLHAETDPGAGAPSDCFALLEATSKGFELTDIAPNRGIYSCSPSNTYKFKKSYGDSPTLASVGKSLRDLK